MSRAGCPRFVLVAEVLLALAGSASAQGAEPSIWYRSSEGCPDGAAFVGKLGAKAAGARLATAGDRIDFVVTLGSDGDRASGVLERQTSSGTVAIRKVEASRCEEVADALALTLILAIEPASPTELPPRADVPPDTPGKSGEATPELASGADPDPRTPPATPAPAPGPAASSAPPAGSERSSVASAASREEPANAWWLGAELGAREIVVSGLVPSAAVFGEYERVAAPLRGASVRLSLRAAKSFSGSEDIDRALLTSSVEACPVRLSTGNMSFAPCVGGEAGLVDVTGAGSQAPSDRDVWLALSGVGRALARVGGRTSFGTALGLTLPLTRYSLVSSSGQELQDSETFGFFASLQVAFQVP